MTPYTANDTGQRICHRGHIMTDDNVYVEKRKNGTVCEHCKHCRREARERFKRKNPTYFRDKNKQFRQTSEYRHKALQDRKQYRGQWIAYFKSIHGHKPHCQICNKRLYWNHKQHGKRACFDHRHGDEAIIAKSPRTWIQNKPCNEKNIALWESCDFGMLCSNCNAMLPTKDRRQFAKNLIVYLETCEL